MKNKCIEIAVKESLPYKIEENKQVIVEVHNYETFGDTKKKYHAMLMVLPLYKDLKEIPFSLKDPKILEIIDIIRGTCRQLVGKIFTNLTSSGILFLYGYPKEVPYAIATFTEKGLFFFRYWIALERYDTNPSTTLKTVHEALILLIKTPYSLKNLKVTRSPHLRCMLCEDLLRDWGGKKYLLHPKGYVIYDIWYEIPMYFSAIEDNFFTLSNYVFDRILSLTFNDTNKFFPIILPPNLKGLRIIFDDRLPIKNLIISPKIVEEIKNEHMQKRVPRRVNK